MQIRLQSYTITLSEPYHAGPQELTPDEAKVLNATRADRLRQKLLRHLKKLAPEGQTLDAEQLGAFRAQAAEWDQSFTLSTKDSSPTTESLLELLTQEVARELAEERLRAVGREGEAGAIGDMMERLLDDPLVTAEALRRLDARRNVAAKSFDELGL